MNDWLNSLLTRIANGTLLPADYFNQLDCDAALNARDGNRQFESEWNLVSHKIEEDWLAATINDAARSLVDEIRRESFLAVSKATGKHEIASYVSDDFELFARARLLSIEDGLPGQLLAAYERGEFPRS